MPVAALADLAVHAEKLGYSAAWLPDHILPPGDYGEVFGGVYEPLVTIGYLAAHTTTIRLGTSVLVAPLRNPFVLAKQVATLQELTAGRMVLGLGIGWNKPEFDAVGARFTRRARTTDETLALLGHLLEGGEAPYRSGDIAYSTGVFAPVPQIAVPIMVGGNSDAALRRAARYADIWQALPDSPAAFAERVATLNGLTAGRSVAAAVRIEWDQLASARSVAEEAAAYRDAGAQQIAVHFGSYLDAGSKMEDLARISL